MAVGENNLQVQISLLRKTLQEDTSGESYLVTAGRGYRPQPPIASYRYCCKTILRPGQVSGCVTKFTQSPPKRDIILLIKG
jgi:DNA-binding winged helix-turn-helix (wHTH) protein